MSDLEHAQSLLAAAEKDLRAIRGMDDNQLFADEVFGFHTQQVVEKSLKAWITALGGEYPFTHDLSLLLTMLEGLGHDMQVYWDLVEYNAFAVQFRYEAFDFAEEPLNRPVITVKVQKLFDDVKNIIDSTNIT